MSRTKLHRLIILLFATFLLMTAPMVVMGQDAEGDAAAEEQAPEEPASEEGVAEEGVAEEGVAEEGVAEEGVAEEGVAEEGVAEEGVAEEGVAEEGVAEEGVVEEGVVEEGVVEEGVVEEGVVEEGAVEEAAPAPQRLEARTVTGALSGNQFAQIWLELLPDFPDANIEIVVTWSEPNANSKGLQFAVLDPGGVNAVVGGTRVNDVNAIANGNPVFEGADNQMQANIRAGGLTNYTIVMLNDGALDASFTLSVSNSKIIDNSGQVQNPSTATAPDNAAVTEEGAAAEAAPAPADAVAGTAPAAAAPAPAAPAASASGVVIPPGLPIPEYYYDNPEYYIPFIDPSLLAGAPAAAPAARASTAATTTVNAETVSTVTADVAIADDSADDGAIAEEPTSVMFSGQKLEGALGPDTIHYLGLVSNISDGNISLDLTFNPQDTRQVNIFVISENDLSQLGGNRSISDLSIAAGNRVGGGAANLRNANFRSVGLGRYTVLVRNSSTSASAEYSLSVSGGVLSDDSGQTSTAQKAGGDAVAEESSEETATASTATASTATTTVAAATTTTTAAAPAASTATAAAAPAATTATTSVATLPTVGARAGSPYTIKSGDSISKIARDVYGSVQRFRELCAFNELGDCNRVEVGDTLQLPTQAQMTQLAGGATITAPAASAPASTATTTSSAAASSSASSSTAASSSAAATTSGADDSDALDIIATAAAGDNFTVLVDAIQKAGLEQALKGPGPFTVFAPTDEAFNALPSSTLETLLADPGGALTQILLYHVVQDRLLAQDLSDGLTKQTIEGRTVQFTVDGSSASINDANLVVTDIETSNGVIHVINSVISPPAANAPSSTTALPGGSDANDTPASDTPASDTPASDEVDADDSGTAASVTPAGNVDPAVVLASQLPVLYDVSDLSSDMSDGEVKVLYKSGSAIEEVADFYKNEMESLDFRATRAVVTARAATLAFTGDEGNVRIGVTEDASSDLTIVELTVTGP